MENAEDAKALLSEEDMMTEAKHAALPEAWTLRAHTASTLCTYSQCHSELMTVRTVYDWLRLQSYRPSTVFCSQSVYKRHGHPVTTISLFRSDILPEWEDPANLHGHTFAIRGAISEQETNRIWNGIVLDCVRGAFGSSVNGLLMSRKPPQNIKIEVWTLNGSHTAVLPTINYFAPSRFSFSLVQRPSSQSSLSSPPPSLSSPSSSLPSASLSLQYSSPSDSSSFFA